MERLANKHNPSIGTVEPEAELYVVFPGGTKLLAGATAAHEYIVPAQYIRYGTNHPKAGQIRKAGRYIMVMLWGAPPMHRHNWTQWVNTERELFLDEVE